MIKVATVCSGIGAPEQAIKNLGVPHEQVFACEKDKYARQAFLANNTPGFMVEDMTKNEWVGEEYYSDLFIGGIPCQAFSLAGKRLGELDPRGLLFYDFYRYVKNQQPKVFIIENVKGLLSDNNGTTFKNWLQLLGQSENTHLNMFNHPDSLMYSLHWTVLNSKDFGVPQNRERVFLVGVRNDLPNTFRFPKGERLTKRLKDILEPEVDEKYYLSESALYSLIITPEEDSGNYVVVREATLRGFTIAHEGDSINFSVPSSETRRGRVGRGIANTLDTACNQATLIGSRIRRLTPLETMRLQGFPDSFNHEGISDSQRYKQAGNSMTVQVMQAIIERLLPVLQTAEVKEIKLNKQLQKAG